MKSIRWQILVAALLAIGGVAQASGAKRFVIDKFDAVGDGKTMNTAAIQALIDKVTKEGGGTLVVPSGTFLTGALFFKQGVNLFIEKDGTLKGSVEPGDYPQVDTRWEGIERYWTAAFLNFVGLKNVTVSGEGTIDGSGDAWAGFGRNARGARGPRPQPGTPGLQLRPGLQFRRARRHSQRPRLLAL